MLRTILVSDHIQIQGVLVRTLENKRIIVSTGNAEFEGTPIELHVRKNPEPINP